MDWPNHAGWMALADNVEIDQDDRVFVLRVVDCGELVAPSGRLVVCDPLIWLADWALLDEPILQIAPGRYRVLVTQADVSGLRDGSHLRNAYATLLLSESPEVLRRPLTARPDGSLAAAGPDDKHFAFGVDTGTGCFVDLLAVSPELPIGAWQLTTPRGDQPKIADPMVEPSFEKAWQALLREDPWLRRAVADEEWWDENVLESGRDDAWLTLLRYPNHLGADVANVTLSLATDAANFVLFKIGRGDGAYAIFGGYDDAGNLARIHIDFCVVVGPKSIRPPRPDVEAGR